MDPEPLFITEPSFSGKQYAVKKPIKSGYYAYVYKAYPLDESEKAPVALKIPKLRYSHEDQRARVAHEVALLKTAPHHHIVACLDYSLAPSHPYLVLEYVPETLQDKVERNEITQDIIINYITQIPTILQHLSQQGLAHADFSSSNLGYKDNRIKVLDFGLAVPLEHTIIKRVHHVPPYNAPEMRNNCLITKTTDIYSAGKTLEYLLTGQYASTARDAIGDIESLYGIRPPHSFRKLLWRMTAFDFQKRPSIAELYLLVKDTLADLQRKVYFSTAPFASYSTVNFFGEPPAWNGADSAIS